LPGARAHDGVKTPFIAVPTTAGTGSEATQNAVLSQVGEGGFKRSLRHDNLVPDETIVDPELAVSCPPGVTAACGMDAFVQLLESYVSPKSGLLTDALAMSGMAEVRDSLMPVFADGGNMRARAGMAYAALLSGITLAHAGLGVVHGFASALGGFFDIPHGVICGTLIGAATRINIEELRKQRSHSPALEKYAWVGALMARHEDGSGNADAHLDYLVQKLENWIASLEIPRLGKFGVTPGDVDRIIGQTGIKNNPVALDTHRMREIFVSRI